MNLTFGLQISKLDFVPIISYSFIEPTADHWTNCSIFTFINVNEIAKFDAHRTKTLLWFNSFKVYISCAASRSWSKNYVQVIINMKVKSSKQYLLNRVMRVFSVKNFRKMQIVRNLGNFLHFFHSQLRITIFIQILELVWSL